MLNRFVIKQANPAKLEFLSIKFIIEEVCTIKSTIIRNISMALKPDNGSICIEDKAFQSVPNVLIATKNNSEFLSLERKLKYILDPGKVFTVLCDY